MMPLEERLLRHCEKTDSCWNWTGATRNGYGHITVGSRTDGTRRPMRAHRAAYETWNGPIGNACVLHNCDNKACINPKHLYLGDHKQNAKDALERGQMAPAHGENNGNSKISEITARQIKFLLARECRHQSIADGLGVSIHIVKDISKGKTWTHIPEPPEGS